MRKVVLLASIIAVLAIFCLALDPQYAKNITVYHVNEHKFGPIPLNMDTGDALGDMFFDMFEVIIQPLICQNGSNHSFGPNPCTNQEAAGKDLMVNKLTLEVDSRFSGYAMCNVGLNGTDPFNHTCPTDTYCCFCNVNREVVPCNATLGFENIYNSFSQYGGGCKPSRWQPHPTSADCYSGNIITKLSDQQPGFWYSSLASSYCGDGPSSEYISSGCTWRVVSVDKIVQVSKLL